MHIRFRVGSSDEIQIWQDVRVGETSFASKYPRLFCGARDKLAKVSSHFVREDDSAVLGPIFLIDLSDDEVEELLSLLASV